MAERKIVLAIAPDGTMKLSVEGVCGSECQALTRPIEEALGTVTSKSPTDEMYLETLQSQEIGQ